MLFLRAVRDGHVSDPASVVGNSNHDGGVQPGLVSPGCMASPDARAEQLPRDDGVRDWACAVSSLPHALIGWVDDHAERIPRARMVRMQPARVKARR